jgi:hypothetical protein
MLDDPRPLLPALRPRHFRQAVAVRNDSPQPARRAVTQHRPLSAGHDSRHPPTSLAEQTMTNRVNAPVNRVQLAPSQPAFNRPPRQPKGLQLVSRHEAVLPLSQPRDPLVDRFPAEIPPLASRTASICPPLPISGTVKGGHLGHAADVGGAERA